MLAARTARTAITMMPQPVARVESPAEAQRSIPFDYTFRFDLKGEPNRTARSVVTVSVEASFTAVSIGYGVIPRVTPVTFGPVTILVNPAALPAGVAGVAFNRQITQTGGEGRIAFSVSNGALPNGLVLNNNGLLSGVPAAAGVFQFTVRATEASGIFGERDYSLEITAAPGPGILFLRAAVVALPSLRTTTVDALLNGLQRALVQSPNILSGETGPEAVFKGGIKLNPQFAELALLNDGQNPLTDRDTLRRLFQAVSAPDSEVQFLYALFDEGTGREFQSEPLLNIAGLGSSNGTRPFRYFARPITFAPRSAIRMEVTEKSDFQGELHVSLHGYKVLGGAGSPTAVNRTLRRRGRR